MSKSTIPSTNSTGLGQSEELSEQQVFDVLSNERRRYAYHYLVQHEGTVEVRDIAEQVAAWEYEKEPRQLTSAERNRVSTALHQFHLPKMDDNGFVEYDSQRGRAKLTEEASELDVYLDVVPGGDKPWAHYYLGLSALNLGLLVGAQVGVPLLAVIPPVALMTFFVVSVGISAAVHLYMTKRLHVGEGETPIDPPVTE